MRRAILIVSVLFVGVDMSTPLEILCITCGIEFDFGALAIKRKSESEILEWLHEQSLNQHIDHELESTNSDYWRVIAGNLYFENPFDGSTELIAKDWEKYKHIRLENDCAACGDAVIAVYPPAPGLFTNAKPVTWTCLNSECKKSKFYGAGQCCITVKCGNVPDERPERIRIRLKANWR